MDFQNNAKYTMDLVLQNHYNRHYNPAYTSKPYGSAQKRYVIHADKIKLNDQTSLLGHETPFLAPLCEKMLSGIDFSDSYLSKGIDEVGRLFEEKSFFGKARIESILGDMSERYSLLQNNVSTLDYQICRVDSLVMQLPIFALGLSKDLDKIRTSLESEVMGIEQLKMKEQTSCWKDVSRLKSDLLEAINEHSSAQTSEFFLNKPEGGQNY